MPCGRIILVLLSAAFLVAQSPHIDTERGLTTITFVSPQGFIYVNLPDDMAAGDKISGTITREAAGANEEEHSKNLSALKTLSVSIAGMKNTSDLFTLTLPAAAPGSEIKPLTVTLSNAKGEEVAHADILPKSAAEALQMQGFQFPQMGQQGWPVVITGPFDGDASNTEITADGKPVKKLAESPRQTTFEAPSDHTGKSDIHLKENGLEAGGTYREAKVKLSAEKLALLKGERTKVTAKVEGLDGISTPVLLRMTTAGTVHMEGGNEQVHVIFPFEVDNEGSVTVNRMLTAFAAGGFSVNARLSMLGVCLQDDKDGHALYFSQDSGAYYFCPKKGDKQSGVGHVDLDRCSITLNDKHDDRRVSARSDRCNNAGSADLEFESGKKKYSLRDSDLKNNVCGCR